jgi:hypothetical protein
MTGRAMSFDGVNDYMSVADNANLDFVAGSSFTISTWIKPTALGSYQYIVTKNEAGNQYYILGIVDTTVAFAGVSSGSFSFNESGGVLVDDTWYHIVAVKNFSNLTASIYINGQLQGTPAVVVDGDLSNNASICIGCNVPTSAHFNGVIDEVKVWNYARLAEQIKQDYERGLNHLP